MREITTVEMDQVSGGLFNLFGSCAVPTTSLCNTTCAPLAPLGSLFYSLHYCVETVQKVLGVQQLLAPLDAAVIHPLLWNPLTALTGYPVNRAGHC